MRSQLGAILIEHLVAIVVLAIVVTGVFTLLSVGSLSQALAQDLSLATNLAQRRLEEVRAAGYENAASLPRQPVDPAAFRGYEWQVEVIDQASGLKQITATVYWNRRGHERSVRLVALLRSP